MVSETIVPSSYGKCLNEELQAKTLLTWKPNRNFAGDQMGRLDEKTCLSAEVSLVFQHHLPPDVALQCTPALGLAWCCDVTLFSPLPANGCGPSAAPRTVTSPGA